MDTWKILTRICLVKKLKKIEVEKGIYWIEISEANLYMLCGAPADCVKHLMKRGLIVKVEEENLSYETGPNAILLSDLMLQNGQFANLAEFPVLQMLYRQGMILPDHPNNTGIKPLIIGSKKQVEAQINYIHRGNYGLISKEEIMATGISLEQADEMMKIKQYFAFGKIQNMESFLEKKIVKNSPLEIRKNVFIRRIESNVFEVSYEKEKALVDLNLKENESYGVSYNLGFHNLKRGYFSIVHSGNGDGWDVNRPTMSSIIMFQGRIYLVDTGPNIQHILMALGISISEIEGIFHTHVHDDHFAGLPSLMRLDHRIKYYATPLVRSSVEKKLSSILSIEEHMFANYFDVQDLLLDEWNYIDGLEVKPSFSPHPVETTIFFFRTMWKSGYCQYAHLADIVSLDVLKNMLSNGNGEKGISEEFFNKIKNNYLFPVNLKKIDIGGGLIHGKAKDFSTDKSKKIILSHTSLELNDEEKEIGSGAPFGIVDELIPRTHDYLRQYAYKYLSAYFPKVQKSQLNILLNNPISIFNPEEILLKEGEKNERIYLILTGNVEVIQTKFKRRGKLSAGALIGELSGMSRIPSGETYRASNFVNVLEVPSCLYLEFVKVNRLYAEVENWRDRLEFLKETNLFGEELSYLAQHSIIRSMNLKAYPEKYVFSLEDDPKIYFIYSGSAERLDKGRVIQTLGVGDFFGEEESILKQASLFEIRVKKELTVYEVHEDIIKDIPIIRWKMLEAFENRKAFFLSKEAS